MTMALVVDRRIKVKKLDINSARIDLVSSDEGDWIGLYVNNCLIIEGHSLQETDIIEALGFKVHCREIDFNALGFSRCPQFLDEI